MTCEPCGECLTCRLNLIACCASTERAVRADERRLLARQVKDAVTPDDLLRLHKALKDSRVQFAAGRLVHVLVTLLEVES